MAKAWKWTGNRERREAELSSEIDEHIRQCADQFAEQGFSRQDAYRMARIQFGPVDAVKEEVRTFWPGETLRSWLRDLRYALRSLSRDRAFTVAAVTSLAIGLGASTAMYSVLYGVLLQPLPFANADRIYQIYESTTESDDAREAMAVSWGSLREFQQHARSIEGITAVLAYSPRIETADGWPRRAPGAMIDPYFFQIFPAQPVLGRLPRPEAWQSTDQDTAVLSFEMWMSDYGGDPAVAGKPLRVSDSYRGVKRELTIIGVLPPDFRFPTRLQRQARYYATSNDDWQHPFPEDLTWKPQETFALARDEATAADLRNELRTIYRGLQEKEPRMPKNALAAVRMDASYARGERTPLLMLFGAALALTLLCCLNVANLMVARGLKTAPEMGVRKALGAGRVALLRGIVCQALVLGLAGCAAAAGIAGAVSLALRRFLPAQVPFGERIGFPAEVVAFLVGCGLVTILLSSAFLAWSTLRAPTTLQLAGAGRRHTAGAGHRTRQSLLAAQAGASLILLCGATLLLENLNRTVNQDFGYTWKDIAAVNVMFSEEDMRPEDRIAALRNLGPELSISLGNGTWALADNVPLSNMYAGSTMFLENGTRSKPRMFAHRQVGPEYFDFMGMAVVEGRGFTQDDHAGNPPVAVVSRNWARSVLDTEHPIGMRVKRTSRETEPWVTVVGVVEDVLVHANFRDEVPCIYFSYLQFPPPATSILLRTRAPAERIDTTVRSAIESAGLPKPELHIGRVSDMVWVVLEQSRFYSFALAAFAVIALLLTAIGVYGVLQHQALQRRPELGIRAALGASRQHLQMLILRQAAIPVLAGGVFGIVAAIAMSRFLESLLHTIEPTNPFPYGVAIAVLLVATAVAGWFPARNASRTNPADCLRSE